MEKPPKKQRGSIKKGDVRNPEGKNGHNVGWQPYGKRIQKWLAMTDEEFDAIANDPKERRRLSQIDQVCVDHVQAMRNGEEKRPERESALDRIEGKPKENKLVRLISSVEDLSEEELAALAGMDE